MNSETILTLLLILAYLIVQILGSRKQKEQPPTGKSRPPEPPASERKARVPSDLQEALREIQEAFERERIPEPERPQPVPERPVRVATAPAKPEPARIPPVRLPEKAPRQATAARPSPRPTPRPVPERILSPTRAIPVSKVPAAPATDQREPHSPLSDRLQNRENLREAFLLSEILGPPRALRR